MNFLARHSVAALALAAAAAVAVPAAFAGSISINGALTHDATANTSSCVYSGVSLNAANGNWTVTCGGGGSKTITISPRMCGSVCTSYSAISQNPSTGNWTVSGCQAGMTAGVTLTAPSGAIANHPIGTALSLAATATACSGTVSKVEFFANTTLIPGSADTTAPYQFTWTPATAGSFGIQARATDSGGGVSSSQTVNVYVNGPPSVSSFTVTSPGTSASPPGPRGAPATFVLNASASDPNGINKIEFWNGTTLLNTVGSGSASFTWANVPAGTYSVRARAYDQFLAWSDSTPVALTVTAATSSTPPSATVTQPASSATLGLPGPFTLQATSTDSDGTVVQVVFIVDGTTTLTATGGPTYTASWTNPTPGQHTIIARATDNSGRTADSAPVTVTVVEPFRLTLASAPVSAPYFVAPATVKFTVSTYPTTAETLSQVTLYMNGAPQGTFTQNPAAPWEWDRSISVPAGTHGFEARATGANGSSGRSNNNIVSIDASGPPAAPNACPAESPGFGATAGSAAVADSGAATYSIPIQVPPGIAGLVPSLSLSYNSQGGNGLAGVGWSLQGLSMIHRCAKNVFIDGIKGEVTHGADDPLCLDGQRLIPIAGTDRNGLIEYRTERESYSRIQSTNPLGTATWLGTSYFKVWTKSGQVLHFGWKQSETTAPYDDAFLRTLPIGLPGKETGRVWALYKIEDRVGNYAKIVYQNNHDDGTIRPSYIEYTGNSVQGRAPFARVTFGYETRPDSPKLYLGGQKSWETQRLKSITTTTDGVNVKTYTLSYASSALTGRSLLQSVRECSGDGVMCLNPTTFEWTDSLGGARTLAFGPWAGSSTGANRDTTRAVDMDGDGKTDLVSRADPQQTWHVCKSIGNNFDCTQPPWVSSPRAQQFGRDDIFHFADFNGDGRADLVFLTPGGSGVTLQLSSGSGFGGAMNGFVNWPGYSNPSANPYAHAVGDFNGDGRAELALYMGNSNWVFCSYNGSFTCSPSVFIQGAEQPSNSPNAGFDFLVADLNGDGRADFAFHRNNSDEWGICHSTSQIGTYSFDCAPGRTTSINDDAYRVHVADVNGDGLADMVGLHAPGGPGQWRLCLSKGDKTFDCSQWTGPSVDHDSATLGDFNGDGRTDVIWYQAGVGWRVCESAGNGFNCGGAWGSGIAPMDDFKNVRTGDFNGDGKTDIAIWTAEGTPGWTVGIAGGAATDLVRRATNGLGIASAFTHRPLTDGSVYAKGSSAVYPEIDIQSPMYVVSRMETSTLIANNPWFGIDYSYRGLKGHAQGGGLAGFEGRIVVDSNTDNPNVKMCAETTTFASFADRRIGLPAQVVKRYGPAVGVGTCSSGTTLSNVTNTWESRRSNSFAGTPGLLPGPFQIWEVFLTASTETRADLNGALLPTSRIQTPMASIDSLGNPGSVITSNWRIHESTDKFSKTTTNTYQNNTSSWIIGRLNRTSVTSAVPYNPENPNYTRVSGFGYDAATGLLTSEIVEPDLATNRSERLDSTYGYDVFGNRNSVRVVGLGVDRTTTTRFCVNGQASAFCSQDGRFPTYSQNAVGHVELRVFDARFGTVTQAISPNNLATYSSFDRMGRKFCEQRPDGSTTGSAWGAPSDIAGAAYFVATSDSTGAASQQHFDALNRQVAVRTRTFTGGWALSSSGHDYRGRRTSAAKPYGDATGTWIYTFDDLNRPKTEQGPAGYSATYAYNGVSTTATVVGQSGSQPTTRTVNNRGEVVAVLDARGSTLQLQYDPQGDLEMKSVLPGADAGSGATTRIYYNIRGQKNRMVDPDQGTWTYGYNSLSEMTSQVDGNNHATGFVYDGIGRVSQRTLNGITTTYTYDSNGGSCGQASIGKVCRVADNKTSREHSYDSKSRLARTKATLYDGRWYERFTTYDSMSRVQRVVYPITGLTLKHTYNANGYMQQIDEARTVGNALTWRANSRYLDGQINSQSLWGQSQSRTYDALGRVNAISTPAVQASSFTFDQLGNLTARSDTVTQVSETFTYDLLNRLSTVSGPAPRTYQYDSLGNNTYRSDIGTLTYRPGTHQLSQVGTMTYSYDPGGNIQSSPDLSRGISFGANGRVFQVTSYATMPGRGYIYEYDVDFQRSQEFHVIGNSAPTKTNYFSDGITPFFEEFHEDVNATRTLTWTHYVNTPEGVSQTIVIQNDAAATRADRLLVRDHLGSTVVVGGDGIPEYQSFDAWGRRRSSMGSPNPPTKTDRGFTGHEMMDVVGLINMNGRLYDPVLGRMMQADPLVQAPFNLQSYNRYSYVLNNPLSLTDPTGLSWWTEKGRPAFRVVGAIVASWFIGPGGYYGALGAFGSPVVSGAAAGFAAGGIQGGNLNSALAGAVSGGLFAGINSLAISNWAKVGLAASAGGVMSKATGGDFRSGFMSAGFNSFVDLQLGAFDKPMHQAVFKSVTGGIASRLGGGSFRDGALTSGVSAFITGTLGPGTEYTEQYADDLSAYNAVEPGRAMMGVRPLDHWLSHMLGDPMFLPTMGGWLEGTTFKLAHEAVFFRTTDGVADNLGFSPNQKGPVAEGELLPEGRANNMPVSSFRFSPRRFGVPFEMEVGAKLPGYEAGGSYQFLGRNCQCFARMFRYLGGP